MMVFFIALLHAVFVCVIAVWTKSKVALTIAAVIAGIIGVATGNPAYMLADLIGVAIGFALGISFINDQRPVVALPVEKPPPAPEKKKEGSSWAIGIVGLVIVGTYLYNKDTDQPAPSPPPPQVQQPASDIYGSASKPDGKIDTSTWGNKLPAAPNLNGASRSAQPYSNVADDADKLVQGKQIGYTGEKLTLNFQNISTREALNVIADFSNINIVISDSVSGNLTLRLNDVPWDQAFDIILQSRGLDIRMNGNLIHVAPREELAEGRNFKGTSRSTAPPEN